VPEVIWRQGIDLNPLDPASEDDVRWLECLIWPGEEGRAERLREAVATARRHPVTVRRGDLLDELAAVVSEAPRDATLVVFHTAVLAYVDADKRTAFADALGAMGVTWLSNEAPGVLGWLRDGTAWLRSAWGLSMVTRVVARASCSSKRRVGDIAGGRLRSVAVRQRPDRSDGLDPNALARGLDDLSNVRLVRGEDDVIAPSRRAFDHRHVDHVSVIGSAS
jgi:hypothetical protein